MSLHSKPIKSASILLNQGLAYLSAVSHTDFLSISTPPFIKVVWDDQSVLQKHELIFQVLNASQTGIPFPKDHKAYSEYVLSEFGESSYRKMEKGGLYCNFDLYENKRINFEPNIYRNGGFEGVSGHEEVDVNADPDIIIAALGKVLEKCR